MKRSTNFNRGKRQRLTARGIIETMRFVGMIDTHQINRAEASAPANAKGADSGPRPLDHTTDVPKTRGSENG